MQHANVAKLAKTVPNLSLLNQVIVKAYTVKQKIDFCLA